MHISLLDLSLTTKYKNRSEMGNSGDANAHFWKQEEHIQIFVPFDWGLSINSNKYI